ncbi:putative S-adenosyl-L-methionine-dependent methyltransferase [Helianthus annuus]|nr:putative S-adenosyl-L-methionine-dependent methyltransferase [Helianthus annuus]
MATGKHRTTKRSSGGSYASTVTTIVFVCIFLLGVWMLNSNSYASSNKPTNRISQNSSARYSFRKVPIAFEDNPGDLPEDAIQPDDGSGTRFDHPGSGSNQTKPQVDKQPHVEKEVEEIQMPEESRMTENQNTERIPKVDNTTGIEDHAQKGEHQEKKIHKQTHVTGGDKTNVVNNEEQYTSDEEQEKSENDMKMDVTGGNDKGGMVSDDEHDTTEDEQEQSQKEETSKDQTQQNEEKPVESETHSQKETKQPAEEVKTESETNTTVIAAIASTKDSKVAAGGGTMIVDGTSSGIPMESNESKKEWKTQAGESVNEKERQQQQDKSDVAETTAYHKWELCNVTSGADYVPCLDNENAIKKLAGRHHFEHRERHCPEVGPTCLVPIPEGYKSPIPWPQSRDRIWFHNVPHKSLANIKGHQNWVKVTGEFLTFPGGGTQFIHGALHYIDMLQQAVPDIEWGKHIRVVLDVGCGVASFGGYLFDKNTLTMSFAPNDEHESQIQFALERGIPAITAVMGTRRLPFPSNVYDLIHCARCRVPWHKEGGILLLEVNRLLRPGGYFVWSATPVYRKYGEDSIIWNEMSALTVAMCWELVTVTKDEVNNVAAAIYRKPESNECYSGRKKQEPPMCKPDDDPNAAWYIPLQACMHNNPIGDIERGSRWPEEWPARVQTPPYWLTKSQIGIYGNPFTDDFKADYDHWKQVVSKSYMSDLGLNWTNVRNVMDMNAGYGGFAAALKDLKLWVLNVVSTSSPDTLPIIFERGLFGIYHDWCESFSTYPRTYDLLHADHLFFMLAKRCNITPVVVEIDRIVRPGGKLIVRDDSSTIMEVEQLLKSLHWEVHLTSSKNQEGILSAQKSTWRPDIYATGS